MTQPPKAEDLINEFVNKVNDPANHDMLLDKIRVLQDKPGVQTSEFLFSCVAFAAGTGFQFWPNHEVIGGVLMAISTAAYALSRGIKKSG